MFLAGAGEVDLTRAISQKVTIVVKGHYARCSRSESSDSSSRNTCRGSGCGSGRSRGRGNYRGRGRYHRNLDEVLEEYVVTDTDDFLGSIFCESPVDEISCNDNSRDCDSAQFCSIDQTNQMVYRPRCKQQLH